MVKPTSLQSAVFPSESTDIQCLSVSLEDRESAEHVMLRLDWLRPWGGGGGWGQMSVGGVGEGSEEEWVGGGEGLGTRCAFI